MEARPLSLPGDTPVDPATSKSAVFLVERPRHNRVAPDIRVKRQYIP
jgi:hypothetical protein